MVSTNEKPIDALAHAFGCPAPAGVEADVNRLKSVCRVAIAADIGVVSIGVIPYVRQAFAIPAAHYPVLQVLAADITLAFVLRHGMGFAGLTLGFACWFASDFNVDFLLWHNRSFANVSRQWLENDSSRNHIR
jgi:hypothetical protein